MNPVARVQEPDTLVEVRNLGIGFRVEGGSVQPAVRDVSFAIDRRSTLALVGESGSGKTVSAMSILGLLPGMPSSLRRAGSSMTASTCCTASPSSCAASAARTSR